MNKTGIYKIVNTVNGKIYIGSAINFKKRFYGHKSRLNKGKHHSIKLQNAWNKYGESSFIFEFVEECEKEALISREQYWINLTECVKNGYNINPIAGSSRGSKRKKCSEETKKKIRDAQIGVPKKKPTEETRKKLSDFQKNRIRKPHSEETKKKLSEINKNKILTDEHKAKLLKANLGRKTSEKTKEKISKSLKKHHSQ